MKAIVADYQHLTLSVYQLMEAGWLEGVKRVSCERRQCEAILGVPHEVYITQSTTVYVPSSDLGLSHPLSRQRVCPSPRYQMGGGAHSPVGQGLGESQFRRLEKKLSTLPTPWCNFTSYYNTSTCLQHPPPPQLPLPTTCDATLYSSTSCHSTEHCMVHRAKTDQCDLFHAPPSYPA
jgi:hypothetical protein